MIVSSLNDTIKNLGTNKFESGNPVPSATFVQMSNVGRVWGLN